MVADMNNYNQTKSDDVGREPWSSGYGRRLVFQTFSHLFVIRIVMFVWKDENKQKEAEDGPFYKSDDVPIGRAAAQIYVVTGHF